MVESVRCLLTRFCSLCELGELCTVLVTLLDPLGHGLVLLLRDVIGVAVHQLHTHLLGQDQVNRLTGWLSQGYLNKK